jgi:hypothetical protein
MRHRFDAVKWRGADCRAARLNTVLYRAIGRWLTMTPELGQLCTLLGLPTAEEQELKD